MCTNVWNIKIRRNADDEVVQMMRWSLWFKQIQFEDPKTKARADGSSAAEKKKKTGYNLDQFLATFQCEIDSILTAWISLIPWGLDLFRKTKRESELEALRELSIIHFKIGGNNGCTSDAMVVGGTYAE